MSKAEEPSRHLILFYSETVNIIRVANLTANTKNYEQITLKTKPSSAPPTTFILLDMETFCHLHKCWYTVIGKHKIILPSPYTDLYSICGFQTDFKTMRPFFNCVGVLLVSGREDNGWTQRSLGNKDIIKVSPSIPSLDLFHLQEPAFTGEELLSHL